MPRRQRGVATRGSHILDGITNVDEWAPLGWHWEVLASGARSLVRNPGDIRDPDLVWWRHHGPGFDPREPAAEEDIHHRIREENNHVQRYMSLLLEPRIYMDTLWQILYRVPNPQMSYLPVRVPSLWIRCAISGPRHMGRHRTNKEA
jgi:hypothetical protein